MAPIDQLQFTFDAAAVRALNVMLAAIVFGAALDVRVDDFRRVVSSPKGPLIGALAQFLLLPAVASLIIWLIRPAPSFGLGLLLVAACPGGAVSNFIAMLARANVALSLTVSAFSTLIAMVMTPLIFFFWGSVNPVTVTLLREISVDPLQIAVAALYMLVVPTLAAMAVRHWRPAVADRLLGPVRTIGMVLLIAFIAAGIAGNLRQMNGALDVLAAALPSALVVIVLVNVAGLLVGYGVSRLAGLPHYDAKSVSLETGLQNAGFGLVLVFQFFGGIGGMALIVGFWGVWQLISGLALALWWGRMRDVTIPPFARADR